MLEKSLNFTNRFWI